MVTGSTPYTDAHTSRVRVARVDGSLLGLDLAPTPKEEPCDDVWRSPAPCSRWPRSSRATRGTGSQRRVQDLAALDADEDQGRGHGDAAPDRRRRVRRSGYRFEAIPDGISVRPAASGRVDLYVNHETSKVPFPYNHGLRTRRRATGESDFDNAQVSQIDPERELGRRARRLVRHPQQRRLPAVLLQLPRHEQGGVRPGHPLHERGVARTTCSGRRTRGRRPSATPDAEENGVVARARRREPASTTPIYGMGRHNHENDVAIPGFDDLVVLSGDDTFTSGPLTIPLGGPNPATSAPSQSQLYSYIASDTRLAARRRGRPVGVRLGRPRASTTTTTSPPARPSRSPVISSRCRRTSPPGRTPTARR